MVWIFHSMSSSSSWRSRWLLFGVFFLSSAIFSLTCFYLFDYWLDGCSCFVALCFEGVDFFVYAVAFGFEFAGFLAEFLELLVEFVSFFDEFLGFCDRVCCLFVEGVQLFVYG